MIAPAVRDSVNSPPLDHRPKARSLLEAMRLHSWPYLVPTTALLLVLPVDHTTALRMLFLVLTGIAAMLYWRTRNVTAPPLLWPLALCIVVAIASIPGADNPGFSVEEIKKELGYGLVVYLAFYSLARSPRDLAIWVLAIFFGMLWLGLYSLAVGRSPIGLAFDGWHGGVLNYT